MLMYVPIVYGFLPEINVFVFVIIKLLYALGYFSSLLNVVTSSKEKNVKRLHSG